MSIPPIAARLRKGEVTQGGRVYAVVGESCVEDSHEGQVAAEASLMTDQKSVLEPLQASENSPTQELHKFRSSKPLIVRIRLGQRDMVYSICSAQI
jgi:hypothetical protein